MTFLPIPRTTDYEGKQVENVLENRKKARILVLFRQKTGAPERCNLASYSVNLKVVEFPNYVKRLFSRPVSDS